MTVAHDKVLSLLGKEVSFEYVSTRQLTEQCSIDYKEKVTGIVTDIVINLNSEYQISISEGDFYHLDDLRDFKVL